MIKITEVTIKNKYIQFLLVCLTALCLTGCAALGGWFSGDKGKLNIPSQPQRTFDQTEEIRQTVDIVADISREIYTTGTNAQSYESEILYKSAKVLQTISGLPTEHIDWRLKEEVKSLHESLLEKEREYRIKENNWKKTILDLENDKSKLVREKTALQAALDKFKFWFYVVCGILALLCFFAPTVGIPLVRFLLGRVKKAGEIAIVETSSAMKNQLGQVVDAIEEFKRKDPEHAKELLDELKKKTDKDTRVLINELKI